MLKHRPHKIDTSRHPKVLCDRKHWDTHLQAGQQVGEYCKNMQHVLEAVNVDHACICGSQIAYAEGQDVSFQETPVPVIVCSDSQWYLGRVYTLQLETGNFLLPAERWNVTANGTYTAEARSGNKGWNKLSWYEEYLFGMANEGKPGGNELWPAAPSSPALDYNQRKNTW